MECISIKVPQHIIVRDAELPQKLFDQSLSIYLLGDNQSNHMQSFKDQLKEIIKEQKNTENTQLYEAKINNLQEMNQMYKQQLSVLNSLQQQQPDINQICQRIDKVLCVSQKKGEVAEKTLITCLQEVFPEASIEDCSHKPGIGDIMIIQQSGQIMIESKNYSGTIPTKEITKFIENASNSDANICFFLAFGQKIANKPKYSIDKLTSAKQLKQLVYISDFDIQFVKILPLIIQLLTQQSLQGQLSQESAYNSSRLNIPIKQALDQLKSIKKSLTTQKNNAEKQILNIDSCIELINSFKQ